MLKACQRYKKNSGDPSHLVALQMRADYLYSSATLSRGKECRERELPDLFSYQLPFVGPDKCLVAATLSQNGKGNDNNNTEWMGCIRNVDHMVCPQGALSLYLAARWPPIGKETPPNFDSKDSWYETKVSQGRPSGDGTSKGLHYNTSYKHIVKTFHEENIKCNKVVHSGRKLGALRAMAYGWVHCYVCLSIFLLSLKINLHCTHVLFCCTQLEQAEKMY